MFITLHSNDIPVLININQIQFITGNEDNVYIAIIGEDVINVDENLCEVYDKLDCFNLIYMTGRDYLRKKKIRCEMEEK